MRTLTKTLLFLCLLFPFVAAASAQTPDMTAVQAWASQAQTLGTPDGVPPSRETVCDGQIGAAHGLCTAYCEAMDCDSANPQASPTACSKVRANFLKQTGQAPPCDSPCPCVSQYPGFAAALSGPISACLTEDTVFTLLFTPSGYNPAAGLTVLGPICGNLAPGTHPISITADQAQACVNLLQQTAVAAGVTCQPF